MTAEASAPRKNSNRTLIIIAAIVVILLAGGAFVAYKLTRSTDWGPPAGAIAQKVQKAVVDGDDATIGKLSTDTGKQALLAFKPADVEGLDFGGCIRVAGDPPSRGCTFTRPGGQLSLTLIAQDREWVVNAATLGPAGLPPETSTTPQTSTTP